MLEVLDALSHAPEHEPGDWAREVSDKDDVPTLTAAMVAEVDMFVTDDQVLLWLEAIGSMRVLAPRGMFEMLKGLA